MTWQRIKLGWLDLRGRTRVYWGTLRGSESVRVQGKHDELEAAQRRRCGPHAAVRARH